MSNMTPILMSNSGKPYWKLGKLIDFALYNKIISHEESEAFQEELNLLQKGINRSRNSEPRLINLPDGR